MFVPVAVAEPMAVSRPGERRRSAHAGGIPLLLPVDSDAVPDQKIGLIGVYPCQALGDKLGIDRLLDLRVQNLIGNAIRPDRHPLDV